MMWLATFAGSLSRRLGIGNPAPIHSKRSADTFGPAIRTEQKPMPSWQQQSDYHLREALSLREAMIRDRQAAMQRRDMRAVHEIEADIRAVTLAMMGRGR